MQQATLSYPECWALAEFLNQHAVDVPESEISDNLRRTYAKIERAISGPEED